MTEKQLERGQAINQEIKYLSEIIHRWDNLTEISSITIEYQFTYNSRQTSEDKDFSIILMFQSYRKRYYPI